MLHISSSTWWPCAAGLAILAGSLVVSPPVGAASDPLQDAIQAAVAKVKPALVRIQVVMVDHRQGREVRREGAGSGTIVRPDGYVVTNHHVVGKASQILCTLSTKQELRAALVGTDPLSDIAVVKLEAPEGATFPAAAFGDSSKLSVGDRVMAMGSPLALSQSVTLGIISNTEMIMPSLFWPFNKLTLDGEDVGSLVRWIGHDAPIYGGNSGGPLVNLQGEIVGVNEISLGLSGAIPSNLVKEVVDRLIEVGRVTRSWIGLEVQPLLRMSDATKGALVSGTIEGSAAERAGFQPGDVLLSFAGQEVNVRFAEELPIFNQLLMRLPIGEEVEATVLRDGTEKRLRVRTSERETLEARPTEIPTWGMSASDLTSWTARTLGRPSQHGVLVRGLRPGGPCEEAKPSLRERDVIVEVAGTPVKSVADLLETTGKITDGKTGLVEALVAFERRSERYLTVVRLGLSPPLDPTLQARKAWLPVATQVLTRDLAERLGVPERTGVRVTQVYPQTTAERAGLRVGDLLLAVDGEAIPASQPADAEVFPAMIRQHKIGSTVKLTVVRDGKESTLDVELATTPKLASEMRRYRDHIFEFTARELAFGDRVEDVLGEDDQGVLIEAVTEGGWAAVGHLAENDLLLSVNGEPTPDVDALERIMRKIAEERSQSVVFHVRRGIRPLYVEILPVWSARGA